jgi:hypothetical protein
MQANDVSYCALRHGVQEATLLTDADGGAVLERISDGPIRITAKYGTRTAAAEIHPDEPHDVIRLLPEAE